MWEGVEADLSAHQQPLWKGLSDTGSVYVDHEMVSCQCAREVLGIICASLSVLHPHRIHFILLQWMHTCETGGVQRCKAETYCFDTEFFISFYMSYEGEENLLTDLGCYSSQSSPFSSSNSLTKALCVFY